VPVRGRRHLRVPDPHPGIVAPAGGRAPPERVCLGLRGPPRRLRVAGESSSINSVISNREREDLPASRWGLHSGPTKPVLRLRRLLHPRASSGRIPRSQAERSKAWTDHGPGKIFSRIHDEINQGSMNPF